MWQRKMVDDITKQDVLHMLETLGACEEALVLLEQDWTPLRKIWEDGSTSVIPNPHFSRWVVLGPFGDESWDESLGLRRRFCWEDWYRSLTYEDALEILLCEYLVCVGAPDHWDDLLRKKI